MNVDGSKRGDIDDAQREDETIGYNDQEVRLELSQCFNGFLAFERCWLIDRNPSR
jgi:hypothetical protein